MTAPDEITKRIFDYVDACGGLGGVEEIRTQLAKIQPGTFGARLRGVADSEEASASLVAAAMVGLSLCGQIYASWERSGALPERTLS